MAASQQKPVYSVYIVSGTNKYNVTPAVISQSRAEPAGQIAQRVTLRLANVRVGDTWLSSLLKARDRVFIYANNSDKEEDEVFRGYLWNLARTDSLSEKELKYVCYDHLIYFQESEDSLYFTADKSTKDIMSSICGKWGIKLNYGYESITHPKLPLRGYLSDIFAVILDAVKRKTKKKYVILSEKDTMIVRPVGANSKIYHFIAGENVIKTASGWTMEGMITQVIIVGKADKDDRELIEATVSGDTSTYGTLQKIMIRDENTNLADEKIVAQNTIDESGKPKWEYHLTAADIPWIRKGDKVRVSAGEISGDRIVVDIDRDGMKNLMTLVLEEV